MAEKRKSNKSRPPKEKLKKGGKKGKVKPGPESDRAQKEAAEAEAIRAKANQARIHGHLSSRDRKGQKDNDRRD